MSGSPDDTLRRLREAVRDIAEEDLPQVMEDARAGARARATRILEDALVDALVERASARETPEPRGDAAGETGWWVYGVVAAADVAALPPGVAGVHRGSTVECIEGGDLAALVSPVPLTEFGDERIREHLNDLEWVEQTARAHEAALDAALAHTTVVPSRLCTIYHDTAGVQDMLVADGDGLREAVGRLRGRSEWGLKVFASRDRLADAARTEDGAEEAGRSDAARYLLRKRDERDLGERVDRIAAACARECHARLEGVAASARVNPAQRREAHGRDAEMILNGVYLISAAQRTALRGAVDELRGEYEPIGLELELTGPWPPYNFVAAPTGSES